MSAISFSDAQFILQFNKHKSFVKQFKFFVEIFAETQR